MNKVLQIGCFVLCFSLLKNAARAQLVRLVNVGGATGSGEGCVLLPSACASSDVSVVCVVRDEYWKAREQLHSKQDYLSILSRPDELGFCLQNDLCPDLQCVTFAAK